MALNSLSSYSTIAVRLTHESMLLDHLSVLEVAISPRRSLKLSSSLVVVGRHSVSGRRFRLGPSGGTFHSNLLLSDSLLLTGHGGG